MKLHPFEGRGILIILDLEIWLVLMKSVRKHQDYDQSSNCVFDIGICQHEVVTPTWKLPSRHIFRTIRPISTSFGRMLQNHESPRSELGIRICPPKASRPFEIHGGSWYLVNCSADFREILDEDSESCPETKLFIYRRLENIPRIIFFGLLGNWFSILLAGFQQRHRRTG